MDQEAEKISDMGDAELEARYGTGQSARIRKREDSWQTTFRVGETFAARSEADSDAGTTYTLAAEPTAANVGHVVHEIEIGSNFQRSVTGRESDRVGQGTRA
jgi:hypothetical protein